ncbi:retrotransposon protein, putative, ty1-copia subclass [Tanacetum coccineum]
MVKYQKEVNEIRAERIAKNTNPLALVAAASPYPDPYYQAPKSHKPYTPTSKQSSSTRSNASTKFKGKEIAKSITPPFKPASKEDSDPEQAQRDKDMQKNLALIAKYFKKIYKPTNNNLRTSSNSRNKNMDTSPSQVAQQTGIQCFNCKEFGHFAKECRKPKRIKDSTYHKEKMLLYKQAEKGVSLQAEQSDWLADTDEEIDEQELEAHYSFMAKIQKVPTTDSGTDTEPLEHTELETYKTLNDRTVDCDKLERKLNETLELLAQKEIEIKEGLKLKAYEISVVKEKHDELVKQSLLTKSHYEGLVKEKTKILYDKSDPVNRLVPDREETLTLEKESRSKLNKDKARPYNYTKLNSLYENFKPATQEYHEQLAHANEVGKKTELVDQAWEKHSHDHFRAPTTHDMEILIKTCLMPLAIKTQNDSFTFVHELKQEMQANLKTSNVNAVCATCGKYVFNSNHDACVSKLLNHVNARTKKPKVVPISFRQPKSQAKKSVTTPPKKTVTSESTIQKSKSYYRMLYEKTSKAWKWNENVKKRVSFAIDNIVQLILFIVDSGCKKHMTGNLKLLCNFVEKYLGTVRFGNDQFALILDYGDLVQGNFTINKVYYVEGLNHNLFSVGQFCDANLEVAFRKSTCFVIDLQGNDLLTGNRGSDLYTISLQETTSSTPICLMAKASPTQAWLWHQRLSHLNFDYINLLSKKDVVIGLPKLKYVKDQLCSSCEVSKAKRSSFKTKTVPSSKGRLNLLHMDLCGPMRVASINGKKYILVIVDDYSRYTWTLFLRSKDETPEVLKDFLTMIQRNLQALVISVRTDRGTEFLNKTLNAFFKEEGIEHQTSTPRTPEQNGVVERRNRTLVEAARTMLSASKLPLFFWAEAIATACYTQNRSIIIPTHEKMAYHIINDRKPSIKHLHIFGCTCYLTRDGENLDKMKEKGDPCILVGYSTQSKGYRVYNKRTRLIVESIHLRFDEIKEMSETSVANDTSGLVPQRQKASDYDNSDPVPQLQNVSPSADTTAPSQQELDLLFGPLYDEFFNTGTSRVNKSSSPTDNSTQQDTLPSTNIHPTSEPSTPTNVHAEENNDDQAEFTNPFCTPVQEAAEYSSRNFGNSNMHTFNKPKDFKYRWTKDHPLTQVRGNPSKPVQTRRQLPTDLEMCMFALTVSIAKPKTIKEAMADSAWIEAMQEKLHQFDRLQRFVDPDYPEKVYLLRKALYGLKQAPRAWYDELSNFLMSKGFTKGTIDPTLFTIKYGEDILLVQIYIDDIIFGSTNPKFSKRFEKLMHSRFEMSLMGEMKFFLGLQIHQSPRGIFINQAKYTLEILKKHGMEKGQSIGTPMATKPKLDADLSGEPIDQTDYRSKIRSLMYLTSSRPDIVQIICYCARYQARPTEKYLKEVKRIFRYLRGTINMGLWYLKGFGFELTAFSDTDHAGCIDTRKSTSGGIQFLGDKLVSWMSKKQGCTAMSSAEAEYVALSASFAQVMWMRTQLKDYGFNYNKIPLYYDSQ